MIESRRGGPGAVVVRRMIETLAWLADDVDDVDDMNDVDDADRVDLIAALEALKGAAAAAQARLTVDLFDSQRSVDRTLRVDRAGTARSVGAQVALARKESPHRGSRHLGLARALTTEMPHTMAALRAGAISEWRATLVARETACTTASVRRAVDRELAARLSTMSDRQAAAAACAATARLDAESVVARRSHAAAARRVSLRPAPDAMSILTAVLPLVDGIAAYTAVVSAANAQVARATTPTPGLEPCAPRGIGVDPSSHGTFAKGHASSADGTAQASGTSDILDTSDTSDTSDRGDSAGTADVVRRAAVRLPVSGRRLESRPGRGQVMADLLVERLTGRSAAIGPDVQINLVMSSDSLLAGGPEPATLDGYGPIPAALARDIATLGGYDQEPISTAVASDIPPPWDKTALGRHRTHRCSDQARSRARTTIRRLFTSPEALGLIRMEQTSRTFDGLLRDLIRLRDQTCRTPYCDAPIRHIDHVTTHADGGSTSYDNAQGLCQTCNYAKEHPAWCTSRVIGSDHHEVKITTPTGHTYRSQPPPLPGQAVHAANADRRGDEPGEESISPRIAAILPLARAG